MATKAYQTAGGSGNIKSSMKMAMLAATQAIANDTYNKVPLTNAISLMPFLLLNILFERALTHLLQFKARNETVATEAECVDKAIAAYVRAGGVRTQLQKLTANDGRVVHLKVQSEPRKKDPPSAPAPNSDVSVLLLMAITHIVYI